MPKGGRAIRGSTPWWTTDDEWIHRHFEELVDKHAGQYAVVAGGDVLIGYDPVPLVSRARKKHPGVVPSLLRIPRPEDFTCALLL